VYNNVQSTNEMNVEYIYKSIGCVETELLVIKLAKRRPALPGKNLMRLIHPSKHFT